MYLIIIKYFLFLKMKNIEKYDIFDNMFQSFSPFFRIVLKNNKINMKFGDCFKNNKIDRDEE